MPQISFPSVIPGVPAKSFNVNGADGPEARRAALEHVARSGEKLVGYDLSDATLKNAVVDGLQLEACVLTGVDFTGAKARDMRLARCTMQSLTGDVNTDLSGSWFEVCDLSRSVLPKVKAERVVLTGSNLRNVHAAGLRAAESVWTSVRTTGSDFREIDLTWANVYRADQWESLVSQSAGDEIDRVLSYFQFLTNGNPMAQATARSESEAFRQRLEQAAA